ncbi:hypothetical protein Tco_0771649 [Tanacetum coccineum]|uniref:Uncharacterized protein n=1 Tax=Tanacetum coccineum TaxID=301880 RepID=A0ABQ4ZJE6_9ASTR
MYLPTHLSQPQINHSSVPPSHLYRSQLNHQTSSVPQIAYHSPQASTQPMTEFPQMDSGLAIPVFNPGDNPIACLNKTIAFLSAVASSRVMLLLLGETVQADRKELLNATNVKDKAMLAEAQGQILEEEKLAFLADPRIFDGQAVQTIIPNNDAFQTEDLDAYDSNCDDVTNAKAVLMANHSNYGSDVISEVRHSNSYHNDMENQSVHAMLNFEQTPVVDFSDNEITSDRNIIPYSQYLQET